MKVYLAQVSGALIAGGAVAAATLHPPFIGLTMGGIVLGFFAHGQE